MTYVLGGAIIGLILWCARLMTELECLRLYLSDVEKDVEENVQWRYRQIEQSELLEFTKRHVASLARALGYEWKRTDAKEGWEKKVTLAEALKETCGGGTPFASSFRTVHYDDIPKYTLDRRKADRRKPAPDIFVSKPCAKCDARAAKEAVESVERDINRPWTKADLKSVFGPGGKKPAKKKPRRAH